MGEAPDDRADRRVGQGGEAGWCGNTVPDESRGGNPATGFPAAPVGHRGRPRQPDRAAGADPLARHLSVCRRRRPCLYEHPV